MENTLTMETILSIISIGVSIAASYYISKRFGDVAGTQAAIQYEKEKEKQSRSLALLALHNEIQLICELVEANQQVNPHDSTCSVLKIPTIPFETVFFSREPILAEINKGLLDSVTRYLRQAYQVNNLVDMYLSARTGGDRAIASESHMFINSIQEKSPEILDILKNIDNQLPID